MTATYSRTSMMSLFSCMFLLFFICVLPLVACSSSAADACSQAVQQLKAIDQTVFDQQAIQTRKRLYDQILDACAQHSESQGWMSVVASYFTIQTILQILLSFFACILVFLVCKDTILWWSARFGDFVSRILMSRPCVAVFGAIISAAWTTTRAEYQYGWWLHSQTPLCGCLIASATLIYVCVPYVNDVQIRIALIALWSSMTILHQNYVLGIFSVIIVFELFGFRMISYGHTSYGAGFGELTSLYVCTALSLLLNAAMLFAQQTYHQSNIFTYYMAPFNTGIYFWATFVGAIAILILCDWDHVKYRWRVSSYASVSVLLATFVAFAYFLGFLIFGGLIFNIAAYRNIGSVFFVLHLFDMQRCLFSHNTKHATILVAIIVANLFALWKATHYYTVYLQEKWNV